MDEEWRRCTINGGSGRGKVKNQQQHCSSECFAVDVSLLFTYSRVIWYTLFNFYDTNTTIAAMLHSPTFLFKAAKRKSNTLYWVREIHSQKWLYSNCRSKKDPSPQKKTTIYFRCALPLRGIADRNLLLFLSPVLLPPHIKPSQVTARHCRHCAPWSLSTSRIDFSWFRPTTSLPALGHRVLLVRDQNVPHKGVYMNSNAISWCHFELIFNSNRWKRKIIEIISTIAEISTFF